MLSYSEVAKAKEGARYEYQQAQKKKHQSGDIIDAEFKVIK